MDNVPSSADKNTIPVRSFFKAAASATPVGAMVVSLMNDEQTRNIEDTLQKHQEQIEMLQEIVSGELYVNKAKYLETLKVALQKAKDEANEEKRKLYASNRSENRPLIYPVQFLSESTTKYKCNEI